MRPTLLLVPVLLALATAARAEVATITFPDGWERTELPAPTVNGKELTGGRHRAFIRDAAGHPLAVLELTELPQTQDTSAGLPIIMSVAQATAIGGFAKVNLNDTCSTPTSLTVAEKPALRTDCVIKRGEQELIDQIIIIWVTPTGVYTLNYTGQPGPYQEHMPQFQAALDSVKLD